MAGEWWNPFSAQPKLTPEELALQAARRQESVRRVAAARQAELQARNQPRQPVRASGMEARGPTGADMWNSVRSLGQGSPNQPMINNPLVSTALGEGFDPSFVQESESILRTGKMPRQPDTRSPAEKYGHGVMAVPARVVRGVSDANQWIAKNILYDPYKQMETLFTPVNQAKAAEAPKPKAPVAKGVFSSQGKDQFVQPGGGVFSGQGGQGGGFEASPYSTVLGYGKSYGRPDKPLETMTMGEAVAFGRNVLIPNTKGKGVGVDSRGDLGSSAMGAYQITQETLQNVGQQVYGNKWRQMPFNAQTQDALGAKLFEQSNGSNASITNQWAGLKKFSPAELDQLRAMPWDQAKLVIQRAEGTAGGNAGGGGGGAGMMEGVGSMYKPGYDQAAMGAIDKAVAAGKQPTIFNEAYEEAPAPPALEKAPHTDWTKADAALADMRPEEIDEASKRKIIQGQMWKAAAQGLMNTRDGAGLGSVLAAFGGGLMAGHSTGDEMVDKKMDDFNNKMAAYKGAIFRNETEKATTLSRELANDVATNNTDTMNMLKHKTNEFNRTHKVEMGAEGLSVSQLSPDGKTLQHKFIPRASAVEMRGWLEKSSLLVGAGERDMRGRQAAVSNHIATTRLAIKKAAEGGDYSPLLNNARAMASIVHEDGNTAFVMGKDAYGKLQKEFDNLVQSSGNAALLDPKNPQRKAAEEAFWTDALFSMAMSGKVPQMESQMQELGGQGLIRRATQGNIRKATGSKYAGSTQEGLQDEEL